MTRARSSPHKALPKHGQVQLLAQIRRATIDDQRVVLDWLLTKFKLIATDRNPTDR